MNSNLQKIDNQRKTVLFLGDSITDDGRYVSFIHTYLKLYLPNCGIVLRNLGVSSETVSGLSEPEHPFPRPCALGRVDRVMAEIHPDWVITCFGINDGIYYPFSEEFFTAYKTGYTKLVEKIHSYGAKVAVMTPSPYDADSYEGELAELGEEKYSYMKPYKKYNDVMKRYAEWVREAMPKLSDCVIDMYSALFEDITACRNANADYISGDGIHPNRHGHFVMADAVMQKLFGIYAPNFESCMQEDDYTLTDMMYARDKLLHCYDKETIGHDNAFKVEYLQKPELITALAEQDLQIDSYISAQGKLLENLNEWKGFTEHRFHFDGYEAGVIAPTVAAEGRPYAWRTEFFGAFPEADIALLKKGWHLVYFRISDQYGCPASVAEMARFQPFVQEKFKLSAKAVLFGFSRGGLYAIHYAAAFPERIATLYLDAPVIDIRSWPGGCKSGIGSPNEWQDCLEVYGLTENTADSYSADMQSAFNALIKNEIPLIVVAGDADEVVPFEENGRLLCDAFTAAGLDYKLIIKKGIGHHPHSLQDATPITEFILDKCK